RSVRSRTLRRPTWSMAASTCWSQRETRCSRSLSTLKRGGARMISTRTIVLLSALWLASVAVYAQNGEPQNTEQRGALSGLWIVQDPGSGSWAEWYDNVPKAQLRPDI